MAAGKNDIRCNDCIRCVWDPVGGGYVMHCYGNDFEMRIHRDKRSSFLVEECDIAEERDGSQAISAEINDDTHRQYAGMPRKQSRLDMFDL